MISRLLTVSGLAITGALLLCSTISCLAVPTLSQQIDPPEANVGDAVTITYTVQNGSGVNIRLPQIDGLQDMGTSSATNISFTNGSFSSAYSEAFRLSPLHPGDFTIPAFDIHLQDGSVLHAREMKLHVLSTGTAPPPTVQSPSAPPQPPPAMQNFNPSGPVVYPPQADTTNQSPPSTPPVPTDNTNGNLTVPTESDGRPAKVFLAIKPQTTDAYVGQSIPMKIEFYIRMDSAAQQDSLPTIKGSDFLMNSLSPRFREDELLVMGEPFGRQSWLTAISAPKSGDFPLQMERDTYWVKSTAAPDPYTNFYPGRPNPNNLAHEMIASNLATIHVHSLPDEGRPANFTGAIGQFTVTGGAQPQTVAVGEPVTLHFTVSGQGNFDYVRCPTLPDDPAWKAYVPSSKIDYQEEAHVQGTKNFDMAIIPKKNGTVPLPQASFSYFDPTAKKYVTIPIDLPPITVTGAMPATASATGTTTDSATTAVTPAADGLLPNRIDPGTPQASIQPIYWQPWFWIVQSALFCALILGGILLFFRSRKKPDTTLTERLNRQQLLDHEIDAMGAAVQNKDAHAFFLAARHAVQLQLSAEWNVKPETLTLAGIRLHDPELAQSLEPLFLQTDEIVYSGGTAKGIDLPHWGRHVSELLQTKPPPVKS
jgi:hypothetical protein